VLRGVQRVKERQWRGKLEPLRDSKGRSRLSQRQSVGERRKRKDRTKKGRRGGHTEIYILEDTGRCDKWVIGHGTHWGKKEEGREAYEEKGPKGSGT